MPETAVYKNGNPRASQGDVRPPGERPDLGPETQPTSVKLAS